MRLNYRAGFVYTLFVLLLVAPGCKQENKFQPPPPPAVTVSPPTEKEVTAFANFTGTLEPFESVEIRARVKGFLEQVHFKDSALVKKGEHLFTIDPKPYQARLDQARADLLVKKAELNLAGTTLQRKEAAYKDNAISEVEVIQARAERKKAEASVEAAQAGVETTRLDLSYTHVTAPISGRIGRNLVDVGNLVGSDGPTLLTTIVNDDPIYAYFNVSENDLLFYTQKVREENLSLEEKRNPQLLLGLANEEGYPHEGMVDFVGNRLDPTTGTIKVRGIFTNSERILISGLFARVRIPIGKPYQALTVPESALGSDQQGRFLLVVNEKNIVDYRPVKTGILDKEMREIKSGIAAGDRVIIQGMQRVRPGAPVTPAEPPNQPPTQRGEN